MALRLLWVLCATSLAVRPDLHDTMHLAGLGEACKRKILGRNTCAPVKGKAIDCATIKYKNEYRCCIKDGYKEENTPMDGDRMTCCSGQVEKEYCFAT